MANRPALFPKSDLDRVTKSMQDAGITDWEICRKPTGEVSIIVRKASATTQANTWDEA
ncbi:MAG: hypothetical protein AAFQ12_14150 [Pseudomonadota bacterium]